AAKCRMRGWNGVPERSCSGLSKVGQRERYTPYEEEHSLERDSGVGVVAPGGVGCSCSTAGWIQCARRQSGANSRLKSLDDALALLAGDAFAPAFAHSSNLDDYRWGK